MNPTTMFGGEIEAGFAGALVVTKAVSARKAQRRAAKPEAVIAIGFKAVRHSCLIPLVCCWFVSRLLALRTTRGPKCAGSVSQSPDVKKPRHYGPGLFGLDRIEIERFW